MEIFHTLNRGVDKRSIFLDDQDRYRFVHDLFEFNDQNWVNSTSKLFSQQNDIASRDTEARPKKLLVCLHAFCLMLNHYHLLLSPLIEGGVARFMKKLNMGYAKYFNTKYGRSGALFEGRYKSVRVVKESHFIHLPYYIHLNPLDIIAPEWRDGMLKNYDGAVKFLESYKWSSFRDYIGQRNFPSVTSRNFLLHFLGRSDRYRIETFQWLRDLKTAGLGMLEGFRLE